MKRIIKATGDGSNTLFISDLNEGYHSHHGALAEARHVFIDNGLNVSEKCEINILELGLGTGLNVLVTIDTFLKTDKYHKINYFALEKYPVQTAEVEALAYDKLFDNEDFAKINQKIHSMPWEQATEIAPNFLLTKFECDFFDLDHKDMPPIDVVYFDCFGARVQPELWEFPLLEKVVNKMAPQAIFTTYASKGSLRRNLKSLGLAVHKRPGPPGKREMINAIKQP